ncbi:MAG: MarR family transcriptional regulator [Actinobacteria bacterium]|nr:MarR family transcriptional regulator [Actinomycetota bacterium]
MSSGDGRLTHAGNLLGALTVALADRVGDAVTQAAGGSESVAAALSSLEDFLEVPTVGLLQQVLGLTPSGAVRLVDRLEDAGFVQRVPGGDARVRHLTLTRRGRVSAKAARNARALVLESALAPLTSTERAELDALLAKLLFGLRREPGATRWTCRLCDTGACGRDQGECPFVPAGRNLRSQGRV